MVLAAPRSGTAWASVWLSTEDSLCIHEPVSRYSKTQLDAIESSKMLGVACTVQALWPDSVNKLSGRKVILHRNPDEIRESMRKLKLPGDYNFEALDRIEGMHCDWCDLFVNPAPIYEFLLQKAFDAERHAELARLNIQNVALISRIRF
jgi:hypothetical protein